MKFLQTGYKKYNRHSYSDFILAGDIGGTNCSLGIFGIKKRPELLASFHCKSKELKNLYQPINYVLDYAKNKKGVSITKCCLGIAGVLSLKKDYVHLTNARLDLSISGLLKNTPIRKAVLMNDFEALGYGINIMPVKNINTVKRGANAAKAPIVVVGAGTGLGKATVHYDSKKRIYVPMPSEIHHADFPAQNRIEMELVEFIKKIKKVNKVSNGDVLSGEGIESIYLFLNKTGKFKKTGYTEEIMKSKSKPELISRYKNKDKACSKCFEIFRDAYAAFAKGCALDALSFNGVYIAGGIAAKNEDIFNNQFIKEFENSRMMKKVLKRIPIYLISDQNAGLLGAGYAGAMMLK